MCLLLKYSNFIFPQKQKFPGVTPIFEKVNFEIIRISQYT